ncbi:MAG: response regulator, partial [Proteobacteria bacterium]|nr:response regulator [Pseudomonadota bacterium]
MAEDGKWRIIVIDDEADIREVTAMVLQAEGHQVIAAADGREGLRLCRETRPQIVITDIRMPHMDGLQVLEAIKQLDPDIQVIVATAYADMDLAIQALQLDASDFITKPVNNEALHLALHRAGARFTAGKQVREQAEILEQENLETIRELLRTFSFQRNLIESSMDGILACDEEEKIVTYNRAMEVMVGYTKQDALFKMSLDRFFAPGREALFKQALNSKKYGGPDRIFLYETSLLNKSGQSLPVQVSATALHEGDREAGLVCFFRDLREIRRLEREVADQARILHQDKMMSLGRLAASVAHEINNPLSGILNYVRLMADVLMRGPLPPAKYQKFLDYLRLVESETSRCTQIVSSLLTFSRKSSPAFKPIQVDELMHRCEMLSRHRLKLQNIELVTQYDADLPSIQGDFNQLQQCVINLIFNAIDAMPEGGRLELATRFVSEKKRIEIEVRDTGPGIPPEDMPHIFEPF